MEALSGQAALVTGTSTLSLVEDQSQIGAARRAAVALGHANGFSQDAVGRIAIVVTEAATNILRHAGHGVIVLRALLAGPSAAVEILALDKGPGIPDVERAMGDGFSTSGTPGQGLGGMHRLADVFELHSQRGKGTALLARISTGRRTSDGAPGPASLDDRLGVVCIPVRGETECGDAWRVLVSRQRVSALLVDGLGHGPEAAVAATIATTAFPRLARGTPESTLTALDTAMRASRGAALSVAVIDEAARAVQFSGVGNVEGRVFTGGPTHYLVPQNGIVGHAMPRLTVSTAAWPVAARLVMHSDGISARWRFAGYRGLSTAHPALVAGVIYRDFHRDRDDATVLVLCDYHANEQARCD